MTTLSQNDLKAIKAIVDKQLKPINERIKAIDRRLSKLEKQNNIWNGLVKHGVKTRSTE